MVESAEQQIARAVVDGRPHLPQQPEQIERVRTHLRRMAKEAQTDEESAEIWKMATMTYGEAELQDLTDVHWKSLTVLDKFHRRDRRYVKKGSLSTRERLTKPRAVWCPRDAAQGEATNPRDAAGIGGHGLGAHLARAR